MVISPILANQNQAYKDIYSPVTVKRAQGFALVAFHSCVYTCINWRTVQNKYKPCSNNHKCQESKKERVTSFIYCMSPYNPLMTVTRWRINKINCVSDDESHVHSMSRADSFLFFLILYIYILLFFKAFLAVHPLSLFNASCVCTVECL